jgi:hypothetical protein
MGPPQRMQVSRSARKTCALGAITPVDALGVHVESRDLYNRLVRARRAAAKWVRFWPDTDMLKRSHASLR